MKVICATNLACNALDAGIGEVGRVSTLTVVLLELVQVGPQQLTHKKQVLLCCVTKGIHGQAPVPCGARMERRTFPTELHHNALQVQTEN